MRIAPVASTKWLIVRKIVERLWHRCLRNRIAQRMNVFHGAKSRLCIVLTRIIVCFGGTERPASADRILIRTKATRTNLNPISSLISQVYLYCA